MVMRYYLGLAVGHTHAQPATRETEMIHRSTMLEALQRVDADDSGSQLEDEEPTTDRDRSSNDGSDFDFDGSDLDEGGNSDNYSDDELLAMENMYGI
jgi:hypothetical protein